MLLQLYRRHPLLSIDMYCAGPENGTELFETNYEDDSSGSGNQTTSATSKLNEGPINQPNTALFCTILALGTFFIAYYLRQFRNSKFLGRSVSICLIIFIVVRTSRKGACRIRQIRLFTYE